MSSSHSSGAYESEIKGLQYCFFLKVPPEPPFLGLPFGWLLEIHGAPWLVVAQTWSLPLSSPDLLLWVLFSPCPFSSLQEDLWFNLASPSPSQSYMLSFPNPSLHMQRPYFQYGHNHRFQVDIYFGGHYSTRYTRETLKSNYNLLRSIFK